MPCSGINSLSRYCIFLAIVAYIGVPYMHRVYNRAHPCKSARCKGTCRNILRLLTAPAQGRADMPKNVVFSRSRANLRLPENGCLASMRREQTPCMHAFPLVDTVPQCGRDVTMLRGPPPSLSDHCCQTSGETKSKSCVHPYIFDNATCSTQCCSRQHAASSRDVSLHVTVRGGPPQRAANRKGRCILRNTDGWQVLSKSRRPTTDMTAVHCMKVRTMTGSMRPGFLTAWHRDCEGEQAPSPNRHSEEVSSTNASSDSSPTDFRQAKLQHVCSNTRTPHAMLMNTCL
jgi:hypothetical protein